MKKSSVALSKPSIHVIYESSEIWIGKRPCNVSTIPGLGIMTEYGRKCHLTWSQERLQKGGDTLSGPWIKKSYQAFEGMFNFPDRKNGKHEFYLILWILPFFH